MRKQFYVYKRNGGVFYVQFTDPLTGKLQTPRSTGKRVKAEAVDIAYKMLYSNNEKISPPTHTDSFIRLVAENKITQEDMFKLQQTLGIYLGNHIQQPQAFSLPIQLSDEMQVEKEATPLLQWLKDFWDYETSDYVQDRLAHGKKISKNYCYVQSNFLKNWFEFFDDTMTLEELSVEKLQGFEKYLWKKRNEKKRIEVDDTTGKKHVVIDSVPLSTITQNNIMKCGNIALEWATKKKLITENPCKALTAYSFKAKERGILNRKEAGLLFSDGLWSDERARVANLVAMTTGLRISEILALREENIGEDRLYISNSFNHAKDGLTTTKNGESRIVPLVPKVKSELLKLLWSSPHKENTDKYIFFGKLADKPVVPNVITDGFKQALESIGIGEEQRAKRNLVFHGWRHFYATTIATELSEREAQLTLGHLTQAMTKHYADHKTEEALMSVCTASNDIFMNMLLA